MADNYSDNDPNENLGFNHILSSRERFSDRDDLEEYIFDKLFNFIKFNNELDVKIWGNNFIEFSAINVEWMKKFLENNNYLKIFELTQAYRHNREEIYIEAKKTNLLKTRIGKINKNEFEPKKVKIPKNEYYKENDEYFSEFILVDNNFYDNLKQIFNISYNINVSKNKVNLIILKDVFIYKISNKILGYGRSEKKDGFLIFKVKYLEILDDKFEYNYKTEIATLNKTRNFEEYLKIQRHIYFVNSEIIIFFIEKN